MNITLGFLFDIITIVVSIGAAGFAVFTWRTSVKHDRKVATIDAYNQLQEQALDKLYVYMPKEIKELARNRRKEEYKQVAVYIARIEHFAVGVNHGVYDLDIVYELAHGFLDGSIRERIKPIIEVKEKDSADEYYNNIKKMYALMDKKQ